MKIAVLGATGQTGQLFTAMALGAGHEVTALVRDASKLKAQANLRVVTGDARDAQSVLAVVANADVVVSCLGHVPGGACPMLSVAFANIVAAAMQQDRPPRCLLMTTIGVAGTSALTKCLIGAVLAGWKVIADYEKADALVRASNVPWVIVRPGHLVDGPATQKYSVSSDPKRFYHPGMKISRADVASFLLLAATSTEYDNTAVQLHE